MRADTDDPFTMTRTAVIRPQPGAGKHTRQLETTRTTRTTPTSAAGAGRPPSASDVAVPGLSPLVRAASPLLLLAAQLRGSHAVPDVNSLRRQALQEIRRFEDVAAAHGVRNEVVLAARYVLCAGLDEAVLSTAWGQHSEWVQQTLLVTLHHETWAGEKFFDLLQRMSANPAEHFDLLELQYLCLAFGFAGKYQVADNGHSRLAAIQHDLFGTIRRGREIAAAELSPRWRGVDNRRNRMIRYVPWWLAGAATVAVLLIAFTGYSVRLTSAAAPVYTALEKVGTERYIPQPAVPPATIRLKQLLAGEETRGALSVEARGGRTIITLGAGLLFPSGSATPGRQHRDVLQRVASALNQVPGRVMVVGHTDDQPLSSDRYRDNLELSRQRAMAVVKLLELDIATRGRLSWSGVGSADPRYLPETDPKNRARNRRVEIIHIGHS